VPLIRKPSGEAAAPPPAGPDELLNGTDDERWEAARSASTVADSPALIDRALAQERNPRVREAMFTSLALLGTPPAIEVAIRYLRRQAIRGIEVIDYAYVLAPDGSMLARSEPDVGSGWIMAELDPALLDRVRANPWFALKKRRPEAYGELTTLL